MSIFKDYYSNEQFIDRFVNDGNTGIDVIIPVYHTNELWRTNLKSIYKEIPVNRLLISDGGVLDNSIEIVMEFPRVEVFNHRKLKSLGKCISELINEVSTDWFIYLHSDVFLPAGWYDVMVSYKSKYDWYGCPMHITVLTEYKLIEPNRPYAGSQFGRKEAFAAGLKKIDDDFIYRQEDFVFDQIVKDAGFSTGKVEDTFHYHQLMYRKSSGFDLNIKSVKIETDTKKSELLRASEMQLRGIVKYLDPIEPFVIKDFTSNALFMLKNKLISYQSFRRWIKIHNDKWLSYFRLSIFLKLYIRNLFNYLKNKYNFFFI